MADVVAQVGKAEQEFQDSLVVPCVTSEFTAGQRLNCMRSIGKQPIERGLVDRFCVKTQRADCVGTRNHHTEEMVETNSLSGEGRGNLTVAAIDLAMAIHGFASRATTRGKTPLAPKMIAPFEGHDARNFD